MNVTLKGDRTRHLTDDTVLHPLGDRVLIRPLPTETHTPAGLWLTDSFQEPPGIGDVLAAGPGRLTDDGVRIPLSVNPGDRVWFAQRAGVHIEHGDDFLILVFEHDLLAVIEEDQT